MSSFENVEIFEDTKRLCETNERIKPELFIMTFAA